MSAIWLKKRIRGIALLLNDRSHIWLADFLVCLLARVSVCVVSFRVFFYWQRKYYTALFFMHTLYASIRQYLFYAFHLNIISHT